MNKLNSYDVSGKIISDISKSDNVVRFKLRQNITKGISLSVEVKLFKEAAKRFEEIGVTKGDYIALINGMLYQKNNKLILKITNYSQILNMSLRKESLDLGTKKL